MAIKISGSTIIDDSRQIINAGNAGIGTTNPSAPVTAANTGVIAAGVGTFHKVYGDGSELINIGLGGTDTWNQDAQGNLVAGVGAGVKRDADTCSNLFIGCKAGAAVNSGDKNIFLGYYAAKDTFTSGNCNIAIGNEAGKCGNGNNQVFLGSSAGFCMSGNGGIAIGMNAGRHKTSGIANVFIGCYAGSCGGTDGCTTIVGALAGKCSEGGCNALFGARAGFNNTSGDFNTFLGFDAACSSTSGSNNVVIGKAVQPPSLTGDTQLAIGAGATTWITGNDTFKVGIGTTTYTASLNVHKDIGGYQVLSAEGEGSTTLEVKTISKTAKHRYPSGGGSSALGYEIDGAESPYLTLTPGRTYRFEQSDSSNDNHPLIFYLEADKTTEYTAGVSYYADGARADSSAFSSNYNSASVRYTEITVSDETPLVLHYQCYNHGYMGNAISFPNNVLNTNYQSTIRADLHVTGIATFGSASLKLDGTSNIINVGSALTLGHSQGIQYHTQNLHATGFEVNQINASGITTFTNVKVGTGATIESNGNATLGIVTATAFHGSGAGLTGLNVRFDPDSQENLYAGTNAGADSDADTCYNVAIGKSAGAVLNSGDSNIFIGCNAGCRATSGSGNVVLGQGAAADISNTGNGLTGDRNVILGLSAGGNLSTGDCNILLGYATGFALSGNFTGNNNIFLGGESASLGDVTGSCNIGLGKCVFQNMGAGCENIALGVNAMANATVIGKQNVVLGTCAGNRISSGSGNLFLGAYANTGLPQVTGNHNIAIGHSVSVADHTASCQLAIGVGNTHWITGNGNFNVGIGTTDPDAPVGAGVTAKLSVGILSAYALFGDGSGLTNITASGQGIQIRDNDSLIGTAGTINFATNLSVSAISGAAVTITSQGLWTADAQENLFAGTCSGYNRDADTCFNIGIGYSAGEALNEGDENIFIGRCSGTKAQTASNNVFLGSLTGEWGFIGDDNVFAGTAAGRCKQGGSENVAIGPFALLGSSTPGLNQSNSNIAIGMRAGALAQSGSCNILIGRDAGICMTTGCMNVAIGRSAAGGNAVTGSYNSVFGESAAKCLTSGHRNTVIGRWAGRELTDGAHNTFIGHVAGCCVSTGNYNTLIGDMAGRRITTGVFNTFLGAYAGENVELGSNNVVIGCKVDLAGGDNASGELRIGAGSTILIGGDFNDGSVSIGGSATLAGLSTAKTDGTFETKQLMVRGTSSGIATFTGFMNVLTVNTTSSNTGALFQQNGNTKGSITARSDGIRLESSSTNRTIIAANTNGGTSGLVEIETWIAGSGNLVNSFEVTGLGTVTAKHQDNVRLRTTLEGIELAGIVTGISTINSGIVTYYGDGSKLQGVAGGLNVQDEGVTLATQATTLNFEGAGVVASGTGATKTITISGGGGGTGAWSPDDDQNLYAGTRAGRCLDGTNGCFNVLLGCNAGQATNSGAENIFVGKGAGFGNQSGDYNIFLGSYAGKCNTVGYGNIALGKEVGFCLDTGIHNFYALERAGSNAYNGCDNIAIGRCAGYEMQSNDNILLGRNAGRGQVFGHRNVIIGMDAGRCGERGDNNVMIGCNAGRCNQGTGNVFLGHNTGSAVTSASGNVVIGCNVSLASSVQDHQLAIGVGNTNWITGIENYNLGIGSDRPRTALDVAGTVATRTFFQNEVELRTSETFPKEGGPVNGGVFGPYTIGTGACLTIGPGSTFTIIGIP